MNALQACPAPENTYDYQITRIRISVAICPHSLVATGCLYNRLSTIATATFNLFSECFYAAIYF